MYMNLLLVFICINVFMPILGIEGLPFGGSTSCYYHADTAPSADPASLIENSSGVQYNTTSLMQEIRSPTNATDPNGGIFDSITQPYEQLYQGLDTAKEYILGGYITKIIDHVAVRCEADPSLASDRYPDGRSVIGYIDNNPTSSTYNQLITKYIDNGTGGWTDNSCSQNGNATGCFVENEVIEYFKSGVNLIMGFLIVFLMFYWITGKGHLVSG